MTAHYGELLMLDGGRTAPRSGATQHRRQHRHDPLRRSPRCRRSQAPCHHPEGIPARRNTLCVKPAMRQLRVR